MKKSSLFEAYLAQARPQKSVGRFALAFFIGLIAFFGLGFAFYGVVDAVVYRLTDGGPAYWRFYAIDLADDGTLPGTLIPTWWHHMSVAVLIFSIAVFWPVMFVAQRIQGLPFSGLFSHLGRLRWRRLGHALCVAFLVQVLAQTVSLLLWQDRLTLAEGLGAWFFGTLLFVPIILLQASGEELVFRGWLVQQLGRLSGNPLVIVLVSSFLFALLHLPNPEVQAHLAPLLTYMFLSSFLLYYTVWRDGGLEVAMALHTVGNVMALALVRQTVNEDGLWLGNFTLWIFDGALFETTLDVSLGVGFALVIEAIIVLLLFARWSPLRLRSAD